MTEVNKLIKEIRIYGDSGLRKVSEKIDIVDEKIETL